MKFSVTLSNKMTLFLMTFPFFVILLAFNYVLLFGWVIAFVDYIPGIPLFQNTFVGLKHFRDIYSFGSNFPNALLNTLALSLLGILVSPLPMVFAILLTEVRNSKVKRFIQTATSLPNFISMVIVYSIFFSFLNQNDGVINQLLVKFHWISQPTNLLGNEGATWYFQTFVSLWKGLGWSAIIYLGSMSAIDSQLYDAAAIDGANRFKQVIHVTVPGLMPTFTVLLLLGVGNLLSGNFEQIYIFHNALNQSRIETIDYYVYQIGLTYFDFSLSTAVGVAKTAVSLILLFGMNFVYKKVNGNSLF